MTKAEAGRIGGTITASRYDMSERGKLGGRPRLLTLSEIQRQQALDAENKLREVLGSRTILTRANKTSRGELL